MDACNCKSVYTHLLSLGILFPSDICIYTALRVSWRRRKIPLQKLYLIESLHDEYTTVLENLVATERRINRLTQKFKTKQQTLKDFEGSLKADRETYNTYVKSKATKQLLEDYRKHISQNLETIERLRSDNTGFRKHLEAYKKDLASVNKSYLSKLGLLCVGLDIPADQIEENSEPGSAIIASGAKLLKY